MTRENVTNACNQPTWKLINNTDKIIQVDPKSVEILNGHLDVENAFHIDIRKTMINDKQKNKPKSNQLNAKDRNHETVLREKEH